MEKQINITSEIVSRIDALGYPCKEGSQDCMIVTNFVKSNLTKLLGDTILNENDFELIRSQHYLTLTSTFIGTPIVFEVNKENNSVILSGLDGIDGEELFRIKKTDEVVVNTFNDRENFVIHEYSVSDFDNTTFAYTRFEVQNGEYVPTFSANLKALGAKYRDREVFELTRLVPPEIKEQSILKRILDGIKSDSFIQITTSDQTFETVMYTDVIFDRLELESKKFRNNNIETGKKLQKK